MVAEPHALPPPAMSTTADARFAALGALYLAAAIALSAYASHAGEALLRPLVSAVAMLAINGLGLLALRDATAVRWSRWPIAIGSALFVASVLIAAGWGQRAPLAPLGGMLMIAGWLLAAFELLRTARG